MGNPPLTNHGFVPFKGLQRTLQKAFFEEKLSYVSARSQLPTVTDFRGLCSTQFIDDVIMFMQIFIQRRSSDILGAKIISVWSQNPEALETFGSLE